MRITLISTEADHWALGMRIFSSVLLERGHEPQLIYLSTSASSYEDSVLKNLAAITAGSGMIGISCLARGSEKAKQAIRALRPLGIPTVWGGIHATLFPDDCVDWADIVCRGEGEGFVTDLVDRLARGEEWKSLANAAYRQDGRVVLNPLRPLLQDLDDLPPAPYFSQVYNLVFFPGTALYERAVADDVISGKADSGFELDYRAGFRHRDHAWKQKNLYLNGLLFLMDGKTSARRLGAVPRRLLPWLLRPSVILWAERHPLPVRTAILAKSAFLGLRKLISRGLQLILADPRSVYNLRGFLSGRRS